VDQVNLVITDLDDTIWDWFAMWYNSFEPYFNKIKSEFSIPDDVLEAEFKRIHSENGSTEFSFFYHDLVCLSDSQKKLIDQKPDDENRSIIHQYNYDKKHNLKLCNGVFTTLQNLRSAGVKIIGFTESNAFFTKYRMKHLNLDGLFDIIYTPIDSGIPSKMKRYYPESFWEPKETEIRYLSKDMKKPAPDILEIIIRDVQANKDNTIYVGDKLQKDVYMANEVGVTSVYAKYGDNIDSAQYELLREVTHWTDEDVKREIEFKKQHTTNPTANYTLCNSFAELNDFFNFIPFQNSTQTEEFDNVLECWKKTIDVQMHFNDLELKIRNFALTAFTVILGGIGYLEKTGGSFTVKAFWIIPDIMIPYSSVFALFGILIILPFFYMDRFWYHRLLLGAVYHGSSIEKKWGQKIPEIKLTTRIGKESPHGLFFLKKQIHSNQKFYIFYVGLLAVLFFVSISLILLNNFSEPSPNEDAVQKEIIRILESIKNP